MRSFRTRVSLAATFASLALASSIALAAVVAHDLTGNWDFTVITENGTGTPAVVLKQAGDTLTGTYESRMMGIRALMGIVKGDSLEFELSPSGDAGAPTLTFIGVIVDADHLKGIVDFGGMGGADFTAVRRK